MAGYDNIKGKGFDSRTAEERRELARKAGKASGEARSRKALNTLLTAKIDNEEWTPFLESLGLDSTLESAINAAMIREALAGNVKAYEAIAKYSGQTEKTEIDQEEQNLRMAATKAKMGVGDESEPEDDGFMDALNHSAASDWKEESDGQEATGV